MTERSLLAAVSGIQANQTLLDEIGNNIANADTTGYKSGVVDFQDLLAEQLASASAPPPGGGGAGVNPVAVGSGVEVGAIQYDLQEGSLEQTGNPLDVAIQGGGYLVVDQGGQQYYTRDGSLTIDANGNLATLNGGLVMGWQASNTGAVNTTAPMTGIVIPTGETIPASATTDVTLEGNLPAWNGVGTTSPSVQVTLDAYDGQGTPVPITLTFTGVANTANEWTVAGTVPNPSGGTDELWSTSSPPVVTFNPTTGAISSISGSTTNPDGSLSLPVGTMPAGYAFPSGDTLKIDFPAPSSATAVTQFAGSQTLQLATQNGYPAGSLQSFSIGNDGTITGAFSNGNTETLGQIALASFSNAGGLADQGQGLFAATANSGQPQVGTAGTGARGALLDGQLEQSNVNLGDQLTDLIVAQEAYTANTKVISTTQAAIQALESV
jgi:flagellar hook protein FlgE